MNFHREFWILWRFSYEVVHYSHIYIHIYQ